MTSLPSAYPPEFSAERSASQACAALFDAPATELLVRTWCLQACEQLALSGFYPVDGARDDERLNRDQSHLRAAWQDLQDPISGRELRVYAQMCTSSRQTELGIFEAFLDLHMAKPDGDTDVLVAWALLRSEPLALPSASAALLPRLETHLHAAVATAFPEGGTAVFKAFRAAVDDALSP